MMCDATSPDPPHPLPLSPPVTRRSHHFYLSSALALSRRTSTKQKQCCTGATLHDDQGLLLTRVDQLADGMVVYVVPEGRLYVWPFRPLGYEQIARHVPPVVGATGPITLRTVSRDPRIFSIRNFLAQSEYDFLIEHAKTRLERSHVGIGKETFHNHRTSKTAWDTNSATSLDIQKRAFQLLGIPYHSPLADAIQIIRYEQNQMYITHTDYFEVSSYDKADPRLPEGTNRFMTILLYLTDVEHGGGTVFPKATHFNLTNPTADSEKTCEAGGDASCVDDADADAGLKPADLALAGTAQEMPHCAKAYV